LVAAIRNSGRRARDGRRGRRAGDVIVVGSFDRAMDFGATQLAGDGLSDMFVAKLSGRDGTPLWARAVLGGVDARSVAVDEVGEVVVTGGFLATISFGGETFENDGHTQMLFVTKFRGSDGSHIWSRAFGNSAGWPVGNGIATDEECGILVVAALVVRSPSEATC